MRPTQIIVDLNALAHNIRVLKEKLRPACKFMAVVKSDAYGHGILEVSDAAVRAGADFLGVAIPEEGAMLREAGFTLPILVLGGILENEAGYDVEHGLSQTVFSSTVLHALNREAERRSRQATVHIKVDTGMNRIGLKTKEDFCALLDELERCKHVRLEGVFTHFAVSEIPDKSFTRLQFRRFEEYMELLSMRAYAPILHCCNSGGLLDLADEMQLDMVRAGLAMYGYAPDPGCDGAQNLRPVLSWKTIAVQVKDIGPGDTVSYGRMYTATEKRRVITLPVGYGDGYKRTMSGRAQVLVQGRRVPVIGRICMDQCIADVTGLDVYEGEEVVLLGSQGAEQITADDLAEWADTVSYEIPLSITKRVPRAYIPFVE